MSGGLLRRPATWRQAVVNSVRLETASGRAIDTAGPMLTFWSMATPAIPSTHDKLPLALSPELWEALTPTQQALFERADTLLDVFTPDPESPHSLEDLVEQSGDDADEVLSALRLLDNMALVSVEASEDGPLFSLRATPEEHVRIQGPDNKPRWVFIARPVEPRDIDPSTLN